MVGALYVIHAFAQAEQASFRWVTIPRGVEIRGAQVFDPVKMTELYQVGYRTALADSVSFVGPPGWKSSVLRPDQPDAKPVR
jgi:hypothetical protein